jgi:hypothetical protein
MLIEREEPAWLDRGKRAATSSAAIRYVHPDHLGSTNVVTDQNGKDSLA